MTPGTHPSPYRTVAGDTVDRLLWQQCGRNDEAITDAFWRLNPDAAQQGPIFPAGLTFALPEGIALPAATRVTLWS